MEQFHTIPIGDEQYAVIAIDPEARTARWVRPEQDKPLYKSRQLAAYHRERETTMAIQQHYTGTLISTEWNKGANELHGGNKAIRNPTGGAFYFASQDEATVKRYAPNRTKINEDFPCYVTFFSKALYDRLTGQERRRISWGYNDALVPINVEIEES